MTVDRKLQRRIAREHLKASDRAVREVVRNQKTRNRFLDEVYDLSPVVFDQLHDRHEGRGVPMILDLRASNPNLYLSAWDRIKSVTQS